MAGAGVGTIHGVSAVLGEDGQMASMLDFGQDITIIDLIITGLSPLGTEIL